MDPGTTARDPGTAAGKGTPVPVSAAEDSVPAQEASAARSVTASGDPSRNLYRVWRDKTVDNDAIFAHNAVEVPEAGTAGVT